MNIITKENFKDIYPNDVNYELVKENKLGKEEELFDNYYKILNNYKYLLSVYLIKNTSIKHYDDLLKNNNLTFSSVEEKDMDFYQSTSYLDLSYFYLRNNLYIEKLNSKDIDKLLKFNANDKKSLEECYNIVKNTYKEIIDCSPKNKQENLIYKVRYGFDNDRFWCDSNELVIGFRYNEFAQENISDEEWLKKQVARNELLYGSLLEEMQNKLSSELGVSIKIIQYDEFSIMDRNSYSR